ncbi:MAG: long-chain fatty acid--CoA ligase, partial [Pyrinomonadaceae bacterium]|nr:long-chain fatty acid--CoA ligase [Pyrinomonadaceae bacterium]
VVLTEVGWYKTGDFVYLVEKSGHLFLTARKKDLFKLSNSKYIATQQLESLLKQSALVSQVIIVGAGRKQVAALIVPDIESLKIFLTEKGVDANRKREDICSDARVIKLVQREMSDLTADLNEYERVKKVGLLPREFSIERGEMTPTLKIKRGVIDKNYGDLLDKLFGDGD